MTHRYTQQEVSDCLLERTGGIDWFRAILGEKEDWSPARTVAQHVQANDAEHGEKVRPWSFMGFNGFASPSIRWGVRDWRMLWETSGTAAPAMWARMARYGGRATRLDVQTTLRLSRPLTRFGSCLMSSSSPTSLLPRSGTRRAGRASDSRGSWCGTVGARTDPSYWRVYDKGAESGSAPPGHLWRIELEAKKSLAPKLAAEACQSLDVPSYCERRVRSSWKSEGYWWPLPERGSSLPTVKPDARPSPQALQLLNWYGLSVKPTIPRALAVFTVAEVLTALGLDGLAVPKGSDSGD